MRTYPECPSNDLSTEVEAANFSRLTRILRKPALTSSDVLTMHWSSVNLIEYASMRGGECCGGSAGDRKWYLGSEGARVV